MSRPFSQGHRTSQSTSALSILASPSTSSGSTEHRRLRASQHPALGRVDEISSPASGSCANLPGLLTPGRSRQVRLSDDFAGREEVRGWLNDVKSLRSSDRRRLAALIGLERCLVRCCAKAGDKGKSRSSPLQNHITLEDFVDLQVDTALISLLTRHAQTLPTQNPSSEVFGQIVPELASIVGMLQGLCLLSARCKTAVGESWILEIFIDMLLLLRAHSQPSPDGSKPIVYSILELLFCVLVDSPVNARTFERLSGLEAVVRVLKGTGVAKEVRMKCIEFLYFYLLPEQSPSTRSVSSTSSSSSSGESNLFPPSPLSSSTSSNESDGRISPSPVPTKKPVPTLEYADIDMPFIPQTPRKPPQPSLGYLTPSTTTRRTSGSISSTPSLATVPASPRVPPSPSSRHLAAMIESSDGFPAATPRGKRSSAQWAKSSHLDGPSVGLGFGLPKSTSISGGMNQCDIAESPTPTFSDPFSTDSRSSSSGSSTVLASPRSTSLSRSSTQPSLSIAQSSPRHPTMRQASVRRVSRSPLVQSMTPEQAASPDTHLAILPQKKPITSPQVKHSRTQSHLSGLPLAPSASPRQHERRQSLAPPSSAAPSQRPPSRPHRAFPSDLTRGLPSSASSPNLASPLMASKRIPSDKRQPTSAASPRPPMPKIEMVRKDVRSVEEKKELLGSWLGNVDALVQGVEKVSFWGSIGMGRGR